jgi:indole-3-glycerol phosphate synthase
MKPIFIAEIKTKSPFGYESKYTFSKLMEYAINYGDWISVHTNALWGGDFDTISYVRKFTDKPILAKGLHGSDEAVQTALYHGADFVLSVDRVPKSEYLASRCIFELSNIELPDDKRKSYEAFLSVGDKQSYDYMDNLHKTKWNKFLMENTVVCNSRDLLTGKQHTISELDKYIKKCGKVIQASNISDISQVNPYVFGYIVGTNLIDFCGKLVDID